MHSNNLSDELSMNLITNDFNSRSFLMFLRRQNERYQEISTSQHDRQYPSKYSAFDNSRGFARMIKFQSSKSAISSQMISKDGITITDHLSKQLLDENLSLVRRHWRRSKIKFSNKMERTQSDLNLQTNISLKKTMYECQKALFNWICKNKSS